MKAALVDPPSIVVAVVVTTLTEGKSLSIIVTVAFVFAPIAYVELGAIVRMTVSGHSGAVSSIGMTLTFCASTPAENVTAPLNVW